MSSIARTASDIIYTILVENSFFKIELVLGSVLATAPNS